MASGTLQLTEAQVKPGWGRSSASGWAGQTVVGGAWRSGSRRRAGCAAPLPVVMVGPWVYLVAAVLLIGLILFLTRSRGRAAAGRRCRRPRAGGIRFSEFLGFGRPSRRDSCACTDVLSCAYEEVVRWPEAALRTRLGTHSELALSPVLGMQPRNPACLSTLHQ